MKKVKIDEVITLSLDKMKVNEIYVNKFDNDGREVVSTSAYVSQERIMHYPARNLTTGHGSGMFDSPKGKDYPSKRNTVVGVPTDATKEIVEAQMESLGEDICIFRIISNDIQDVIGSKVKSALEKGQTNLDLVKTKHIMRDSDGTIFSSYLTDGTKLKDDARKIGTVVFDENDKAIGVNITNENALVEYKVDVFSRTYRADEDNRQFVKKGTQQEVVEEVGNLTA